MLHSCIFIWTSRLHNPPFPSVPLTSASLVSREDTEALGLWVCQLNNWKVEEYISRYVFHLKKIETKIYLTLVCCTRRRAEIRATDSGWQFKIILFKKILIDEPEPIIIIAQVDPHGNIISVLSGLSFQSLEPMFSSLRKKIEIIFVRI